MQPIQQQLIDIQDAVSQVLVAKTAGATAAEASMSKVQGISVTARMQDVETVEFTNDGGLASPFMSANKKALLPPLISPLRP